MSEDQDDECLGRLKQVSKDQRDLDMCAEGFDVGSLSRLMGSEAVNYTAGLEDLYSKMLVKIENLSRLVEKTSAKVLEQVCQFNLLLNSFYFMVDKGSILYVLLDNLWYILMGF